MFRTVSLLAKLFSIDYLASKVFFKQSNLHDDFACLCVFVCVCVYVCAYVCTRRKPLRNESRWTRGITRREKQLRKKFNLFLECLRVARIISKIFRLFCKYTGCQKEEFYKDWRRFSHSSKGVKYVSINIGNCFDEKINFFYCPSFCIFYISIQIIVLLF